MFCKKLLLNILENSQENTCARVSFLIKLQALAWNLIKKETLAQGFPKNFAKFVRTPSFVEQLRWLFLYKVAALKNFAKFAGQENTSAGVPH